jgi:hypothetical protein
MHNLFWTGFEFFTFLIFQHTFAILTGNIFPLTETKDLKTALLLPSKGNEFKKTCPSPPPKKDSCPKNIKKSPSARLHYMQLLYTLQKHVHKKVATKQVQNQQNQTKQ